MTHSAARAAAGEPVVEPQVAPAVLSADGESVVVSQMVWNSVLESLSSTVTSQPQHLVQPSFVPPSPIVTEVPPPPVPVESLHIEPISPALADNSTIAALFVASAPIDFSELPVAPAPAIAPPPADVLQPAPAPAASLPVVAEAPGLDEQPAPAVMATDVAANVIVPAMPTLAPPTRAAAPPKPVRDLMGDDSIHTVAASSAKKKKRRPFKALFSFVIVMSLIGGAAYAGWYYFVRKKVEWSAEVQPLATFVEDTTGRKFTELVSVTVLEAPDYEAKLGAVVLDRSYADADGQLSAMRAVGLVAETPAVAAAGHQAAASTTSFYDPATHTIYALDGATGLFKVSMLRSLTAALADQEFGWSNELTTLDDSQQAGYLALIDGVGNRVVAAQYALEPALEEEQATELVTRESAAGIGADGVPFSISGVVTSTQLGAVSHPAPPSDDPMQGLAAPSSDGVVFDPIATAFVAATSAPGGDPAAASGARNMGMQFWYESLVPALGVDNARTAALLWMHDTSIVTNTANRPCIESSIVTANEVNQSALAGYMSLWVQSRPASSTATVTSEANNVVRISMCQPTEAIAAPLSSTAASLLYTAARTERDFVTELSAMQLPNNDHARNCAVLAYRGGGVANFQVGSTDPTVTEAMTNIVTFCKGA